MTEQAGNNGQTQAQPAAAPSPPSAPTPTPTLPLFANGAGSQPNSSAQPTPPVAPAGAAQQQTQAQKTEAAKSTASRPENFPVEFWDETTGGVKLDTLTDRFNQLLAMEAATNSRTLAVPEKAEDYQLRIAPEVASAFPEGFSFQLNEADPLFIGGRELAHHLGIDQSGFEAMVGVYALVESRRAQENALTQKAEFEKLGPKGMERGKAIEQFLSARYGDDLAKAVFPSLRTAQHVMSFEKLMRDVVGSGSASIVNDAAKRGQFTQAQWDKMTPNQRMTESLKAGTRANSGARRH